MTGRPVERGRTYREIRRKSFDNNCWEEKRFFKRLFMHLCDLPYCGLNKCPKGTLLWMRLIDSKSRTSETFRNYVIIVATRYWFMCSQGSDIGSNYRSRTSIDRKTSSFLHWHVVMCATRKPSGYNCPTIDTSVYEEKIKHSANGRGKGWVNLRKKKSLAHVMINFAAHWRLSGSTLLNVSHIFTCRQSQAAVRKFCTVSSRIFHWN